MFQLRFLVDPRSTERTRFVSSQDIVILGSSPGLSSASSKGLSLTYLNKQSRNKSSVFIKKLSKMGEQIVCGIHANIS